MHHDNWWNGNQENCLKCTEILDLKDWKWVQGPEFAVEIRNAACVALPSSSNFACVVVRGRTGGLKMFRLFKKCEENLSNVYGLDKSLKEWTLLGKLRKGRHSHIALPIYWNTSIFRVSF